MNSYKDSGVEWIGEIPKYWKVKKIKQLVTNIKSLFKDNAIFLNINGFHIIKEGAIENGMGIMNM